jgi:hypothetical protein
MNLLTETLDSIEYWNLLSEDITFIGSLTSGYRCTWDEYRTLADIEYDNGRGAQEIAIDLVIVFKNKGMLYRWENKGSEGWTYQEPFLIPEESRKIVRLTAPDAMWWSLAKINKEI